MKMPEPIISAVVYFDRCPDRETVIDAFERHIWPLYRFNCYVANGNFIPVTSGMNRAYHIVEKAMSDEIDIHAHVQGVMNDPLDHKHPLWAVTILRCKQGRSAILLRIHHVISDGLGLLFAFAPMLECEGGDVLSKIPLPGLLLGRSSGEKRSAEEAGPSSRQKRTPFAAIESFLYGILMSMIMFCRGVLSLILLRADSEIKMNPPLAQRTPYLPFTGRQYYTRMPSVPMSAVGAVRKKHGCTVNEAIVAALTGALRRYGADDLKDPFLKVGATKALEFKSIVMLGLPRPIDANDPSISLANNIVTPPTRLPIDEASALGRLRRTVAVCHDMKSMAYITGINLTTKFVTAIASTNVLRRTAAEVTSKCSLIITSVPLTTVPVSWCGEEVKEAQCFVVQTIPQISLLSYNGFIHWNMVADRALVPDAAALSRHFLVELEELSK